MTKISILLRMSLLITSMVACRSESRQDNQRSSPALAIDTMAVSTPNEVVFSDQRTVKLTKKAGMEMIAVNGYVEPDPSRTIKVAARFSGRIDNLYFNYNYQFVRRGEKIMEVYSPELNAARDEYLYLLQHPEDELLLENARKKLRYLGVSAQQIRQMPKQGGSQMPVFSPLTGYLLPKKDDVSSSSVANRRESQTMNKGTMSGSGSPEAAADETAMKRSSEPVREGSYISRGETLFSVNDLKEVWGIFAIEPRYGPSLRTGLPVEVQSELLPNQAIHGKINYIEPQFATTQNFITIRVFLNNQNGRLKTNSLLTARIFLQAPQAILVPETAVYDLGTRKIVWVYTGRKHGNYRQFKKKEVVTGLSGNGVTAVIKGLSGSEEIAKDAGFLIDSESVLPFK